MKQTFLPLCTIIANNFTPNAFYALEDCWLEFDTRLFGCREPLASQSVGQFRRLAPANNDRVCNVPAVSNVCFCGKPCVSLLIEI